MAVYATESEEGTMYTCTKRKHVVGNGWLARATKAQVRQLDRRLAKRGWTGMTTDQATLWKAVKDHLRGEAVLMRQTTRFTTSEGNKHESTHWVRISNDTRLRAIANKPGFTK